MQETYVETGETKMTAEIAKALNVAEAFIANVVVDGKTIDFDLNGVAYYAKLTRGKFNADNMRRAI